MSNDEILSTLFSQRWQHCTLRLSSGEAITVTHPDYLFMPPARDWVLWVKPDGKGLQIIPTHHIASIELRIASSPAATGT
jgi:hypothetical protein